MALVDRPKNNLQQHLAWFTSHKPQIPPKGYEVQCSQANAAYTCSTPVMPATNSVVPLTAAGLPSSNSRPSQATGNRTIPANLADSVLASPRRLETEIKRREIDAIPSEAINMASPERTKIIQSGM